MPDMTGNAALDVAIGLFFVFFVLSIVCSAITEVISAVLKLRARDLERGVHQLLDGDQVRTTAFFQNPRVRALWRQGGRLGERKPSYIPPRVFAKAFIDTLAPEGQPGELNMMQRAQATVATLPPGAARAALQDALSDGAAGIAEFRKELETSFDEVMDRASGWFKRRAQVVLLIVSLLVVGVTNADSLAITQRLFNDDAVRAAVVAQADKVTDSSTCPDVDTDDPLERASECVGQLKALNLPFGWSDATTPDGGADWLEKVGGLLMTVVALSLGAPFWFDVLGKMSRLRATGNREGTAKTERAAEDRDDPSGLTGGSRHPSPT